MYKTAQKYIKAGLSVLPVRKNKAPALPSWEPYQERRASESEIKKMFSGAVVFGIAVICGEISGGLECLDFDSGGAVYPDWKEKIPPELFRKLTVEKSPHGIHVYFRSNAVEGNAKLANAENHSVLIETRGTGGYCICDPTPGYSLIQGSMLEIQTITPEEREKLMEAAREFNQVKKQRPPKSAPKRTAPNRGQDFSPADYFSDNGDIRAILKRNGWTPDGIATDGNERWTRPGKESGTSGTLKENENGVLLFYPFTTSTEFEANQGYNAFQVLSILEHGGNQSDAARAIRERIKQAQPSAVPLKKDASAGVEMIDNDSGEMMVRRQKESFQEFPLEVLPEITREFVITAAGALNCNVATVACSLLVTAGATIGARVKLRLGGAKWQVAPFLWLAVIGASSMGKSPSLKQALELLGDKKRQFKQEFKEQMDEYKKLESKAKKILSRIGNYELQAFEAECDGDSEKAQALRARVENMEKNPALKLPKKPLERILEVSGAFTLPGLIDKAQQNKFGFLVRQDELTSLFASLANSNEIGASGELLIFKDGGSSQTALKTEELNRSANECWAAILGGIVPKNLRRYILGNEKQDDGFLSRFLCIFPPMLNPDEFQPERELTEAEAAPMKKVLEALADFQPEYIPSKDGEQFPVSRSVVMSDEAKTLFNEKRKQIYAEKFYSVDESEGSLFGKADDTLGRLMLLLHALDGAEKYVDEGAGENIPFGSDKYLETHPISADVYRRAETLTDWFLNETRQVYKIAGFVAAETDLDFIAGRLKDRDSATTAEIANWKSYWKSTEEGRQELERILVSGLHKGLWSVTKKMSDGNNKMSEYYSAVK